MQAHQLRQPSAQKSKRRVGRGGKRGTYSGRGIKGQKSRAGRKIRPAWRDLIKQIPKRRGYRFKPVAQKPAVLNLGRLNDLFNEGDVVSLASLIAKGVVGKIKGREPGVKILGEGAITKKMSFSGVTLSKNAREKIERAGGTIK